MNLSKTNSELFKHKYFNKYLIFLFIFTFGVGMLLYQIYVNSIQTSIIEGLSLDTSNPRVSSLLDRLAGFFQNQCFLLVGKTMMALLKLELICSRGMLIM